MNQLFKKLVVAYASKITSFVLWRNLILAVDNSFIEWRIKMFVCSTVSGEAEVISPVIGLTTDCGLIPSCEDEMNDLFDGDPSTCHTSTSVNGYIYVTIPKSTVNIVRILMGE